MSNTSSRALRLLSLLQSRRWWPGSELAERLGISIRTLRRDVDRLRALGYPVESHRGIDGGYQLVGGAQLPPLAVDEEEAVALAIGLRAAAQGSVAGIEEASIRALTKITQVMPAALRRRVDGLNATIVPSAPSSGPSVAVDTLTGVAQACRDHEELAFGYRSRVGDVSQRRVEPHSLVSLGFRWYLVAYDPIRQDWRSFRLDRMSDPKGTGSRFAPRRIPLGDAAAFVRSGIENIPSRWVRAIVHAPASEVQQRLGPWCSVESLDRTTCRLEMKTDSLDWPAFALGIVGARFEVLEPPELVAQLKDWGTRFSQATEGAG